MQTGHNPNHTPPTEATSAPQSAEHTPEGNPGAETTPQAATEGMSGLPEAAETNEAPAEPTVPRTERSYWVDIAAAMNAAHTAGMPVGIDLDGTLTDHSAWSDVPDRDILANIEKVCANWRTPGQGYRSDEDEPGEGQ